MNAVAIVVAGASLAVSIKEFDFPPDFARRPMTLDAIVRAWRPRLPP